METLAARGALEKSAVRDWLDMSEAMKFIRCASDRAMCCVRKEHMQGRVWHTRGGESRRPYGSATRSTQLDSDTALLYQRLAKEPDTSLVDVGTSLREMEQLARCTEAEAVN